MNFQTELTGAIRLDGSPRPCWSPPPSAQLFWIAPEVLPIVIWSTGVKFWKHKGTILGHQGSTVSWPLGENSFPQTMMSRGCQSYSVSKKQGAGRTRANAGVRPETGRGREETELNHCRLEKGAITTHLVDLQGRWAGSAVDEKRV